MHVFDKTCHEAYALEKTQEVTGAHMLEVIEKSHIPFYILPRHKTYWIWFRNYSTMADLHSVT